MNRPAVRLGVAVFMAALTMGFVRAQDQPKAKLETGIECYKAGKYVEAVEIFRQVILVSLQEEELFRAHLYLGYTHFSLQQMDEAKAQVEKAIGFNPGYNPNETDFISEYVAFYGKIKESVVGIAFFSSLPTDAVVYLDGNLLGRSPLKKELLAGSYRLRIARGGYEPFEALFDLKKAERSTIKVDFRNEPNWKTFARAGVIFGVLLYLIQSF